MKTKEFKDLIDRVDQAKLDLKVMFDTGLVRSQGELDFESNIMKVFDEMDTIISEVQFYKELFNRLAKWEPITPIYGTELFKNFDGNGNLIGYSYNDSLIIINENDIWDFEKEEFIKVDK